MLSKLVILSFLFILCWDYIKCEGSLIDLTCGNNDDCSAYESIGINATCTNSRCFCFDKLNHSQDCIPNNSQKISNIIGAQCPCFIKNSHCDTRSSKCICDENYMPSGDKRSCIKKIVHLGDDCESDDQCVAYEGFSNCDLGTRKCACQTNFTQVEQSCRSRIALGNKCDNDRECLENTIKTVCLDHTCVCENNYVAKMDGTVCLESAGFGESCTETKQCLMKLGVGSKCDSGMCVCGENHYKIIEALDTPIVRCEAKIFAGDSCADHHDCYQYHIEDGYGQTMECSPMHICQCKQTYDEINKLCFKKSFAVRPSSATLLILTMFGLVLNLH